MKVAGTNLIDYKRFFTPISDEQFKRQISYQSDNEDHNGAV